MSQGPMLPSSKTSYMGGPTVTQQNENKNAQDTKQ